MTTTTYRLFLGWHSRQPSLAHAAALTLGMIRLSSGAATASQLKRWLATREKTRCTALGGVQRRHAAGQPPD
jgi:hypothetical protein